MYHDGISSGWVGSWMYPDLKRVPHSTSCTRFSTSLMSYEFTIQSMYLTPYLPIWKYQSEFFPWFAQSITLSASRLASLWQHGFWVTPMKQSSVLTSLDTLIQIHSDHDDERTTYLSKNRRYCQYCQNQVHRSRWWGSEQWLTFVWCGMQSKYEFLRYTKRLLC